LEKTENIFKIIFEKMNNKFKNIAVSCIPYLAHFYQNSFLMNSYLKVKNYLLELNHDITHENQAEGIIIIADELLGIKDLVIDCNEPLLIMEQFIVTLRNDVSAEDYLRLLQINRQVVHGAFGVDVTGKKLLYRNTLQLENLDLNELQASINSISLALSENSEFLLNISTSTKIQSIVQ
jgi:hypothetical protein